MNVNDTQSVVTQVIQSLVDAWNRRDATQFANLFSEDAHYIDGNGRCLKGRRAIGDLCVGAGQTVSVAEEPSIRVYGDVAIGTFRWMSVEDKSIGGIITCVVIQTNTNWTIVALQNTDLTRIEPRDEETQFGPLYF
ncbi:MAG TPA: SgcJ/EcaC family oxidoreductase [Pyrinomonadaceae bacterium]|jgi:hypothetical protein|nr:SgcJ/EcaC family oxidoreductase [Pyrinomonadaceae bacterium]